MWYLLDDTLNKYNEKNFCHNNGKRGCSNGVSTACFAQRNIVKYTDVKHGNFKELVAFYKKNKCIRLLLIKQFVKILLL